MEVASPTSRDAAYNDRTIKPVQYAKGGVPLYPAVRATRLSPAEALRTS